jgi:hypothetical protein
MKDRDAILNHFRKPNSEIIICGDIYIDYLNKKCYKQQQLDALLVTYNLISTVRSNQKDEWI